MRIGYASADWGRDEHGTPSVPGGAGWVRIHQIAEALRERGGHETWIGHGLAARPDGLLLPVNHEDVPLTLDPPEVIVHQRWMHAEAADAIRAARDAGQLVVADVDDWFWGLDPRNRAWTSTHPRLHPQANREHYRRAVEASDLATVSTGFLARRIRERFGTRTVVLRNPIRRAMYATQGVRPVGDGLVVGWVGALGWRSGDLETLRGALDPFLAAHNGTFVHHGTFGWDTVTAAELAGVDPDRAGPTRPALPPWEYPDNVAGFDIGIVPLSDQPFNHAKSWIKGLEYATAGIPFVAARTREYEVLGCGLLASTPAEWRDALERLADPAEREAQRATGLAVAAGHDVDVRWPAWIDAYTDALPR